jgi:hypothetical protein
MVTSREMGARNVALAGGKVALAGPGWFRDFRAFWVCGLWSVGLDIVDHAPALFGAYWPALGYRPLHVPLAVVLGCLCLCECALGVGRILWEVRHVA